MAFGDYQLEIYLQGLSGILPSLPMSFAELGGQGAGGDVAVVVVIRRGRRRR